MAAKLWDVLGFPQPWLGVGLGGLELPLVVRLHPLLGLLDERLPSLLAPLDVLEPAPCHRPLPLDVRQHPAWRAVLLLLVHLDHLLEVPASVHLALGWSPTPPT